MKAARILFLIAAFLIGTIAMVLIVSSLLFFAGISVSKWQFPFAFISTAALIFIFGKDYFTKPAIFIKACLFSIVIITASVLIALYFYDVSYDGQSYHLEGIYQLKNGWNPFRTLLPDEVNFSIYINHYSKGVEIPQSAVYSLVNRIEAGKATNFILLAAAFCLTLSFLLQLKRLPASVSILLSLIATLNPVAVNQLISTYVDGQLTTILLCFFVTALLVVTNPQKLNFFLLCAVIVIGVNIKFTGLIYIVFFSLALLAWLLFVKKIIDNEIQKKKK